MRTRCGDFDVAQRRAVHVVPALLVRCAESDHGLAADQRRLDALRLGGVDRGVDRLRVVPVHVRDHVPAVGLEALRRVVGEPAFDVAVDRNAVVVVEADQLAEPQRAGQRAGFVRNAFHQAAVAEEHVGVVIDDVEAVAVELGGEHLLGQRHAHRVGQALAERSGGRFHAGRVTVFGVPRCLAVQLAELLDVVDRQVVAGQVQQRVKQHRPVAVRQHEPVAVGPLGILRVVAKVMIPQHFGDFRHAHRRAGVAGIGLLHGVHGERTNGAGEVVEHGLLEIAECRHQMLPESRGGRSENPELSPKPAPLNRIGPDRRTRCKSGGVVNQPPRTLRAFSARRRIIGVKMSCIARSILPPGTTIVLDRDMNESWIIDSR